MSWSLQVSYGDFPVSGNSLGIVAGANKLGQDLRHWVLEKMGTDPLHLDYGSLIDGGRTSDGVEQESIIGHVNDRNARVLIESELRRIIQAYQRQQIARAKADRLVYNKT